VHAFDLLEAIMSDRTIWPEPRVTFTRRAHWLDNAIVEIDMALHLLTGGVRATRPNPAGPLPTGKASDSMDAHQRAHAAGLMRVNHVGEVCAQALYRGQALVCRDDSVRAVFQQAAREEIDHLAWCGERLSELSSRPSLLNPVWYAGSFAMGLIAGKAGVARNLGFMAETERQVEAHLDNHLTRLPAEDSRSRAIVSQMKKDEADHRMTAQQRGAANLSLPARLLMKLTAKVMTVTAYKV